MGAKSAPPIGAEHSDRRSGDRDGSNPAVRSQIGSRPHLTLLQPSECGRSATWRLGQCRGPPVFSSVTSNDRKRSNNAVLR